MSDPIASLLHRGTAEVIVLKNLERKLRQGKKLRIKLGIDPTGSVLHIGHAVVLRKMRQFQDLGHQVIFLIGDFTARIGDPSGRNVQRKPMTDAEIEANMRHYIEQASLILDRKKLEVRYNSEWLAKLDFKDLIFLTSKVTYAQVAQRADFKKRIKNDVDLTLQEFLYPIMQGYDSVALKADVEMGGTDQTFNLLMGRQIQERYDQPPQDVLTCPILEGLDGKEKMSKSLNNYIALTDAPNEMYSKTMSIPDPLILRYFELATNVSHEELQEIAGELKSGKNPRNLKMHLARELVALYHNTKAAREAEAYFVKVFSKKEVPDEMDEVTVSQSMMSLLDLIRLVPSVTSNSEARRLIEGGGVRVDSTLQRDGTAMIEIPSAKAKGLLLQVGKRRFLRVNRK